METLVKLFKNNIRQYGMIIALVVIMILFEIITGGLLLKPINITNLILQNSYILVLAIGMVLVIITGHIDLSVGSIAAFVGAVAAIMMVDLHWHPVVAVIASLVVGALIGAWQGFWVAYVKIPAFIVTLAGMLLFRGLTMIVLKGQSIAPFPNGFQKISSGFIPDFGSAGTNIVAVLAGILFTVIYIVNELRDRRAQKKYNFEVVSGGLFILKLVVIAAIINAFTFMLAIYAGLPNILILLLVLIIIYSFVMNKTVMGRHIYALGGNEKAADLSGVKTKKVTFWVFVNMGVLAAISGLIFAARLNAATPRAGTNFELDAIAASFIGGASATGGIGTVFGAIIGGLVMGVLNNGMSLIGLGVDWQQGIKGLVLLAAVAFDIYNKKKVTFLK
ncbi:MULTISPECIES: multiple monosaccharide ABC transporter permease [Paenibacillus]|jgi:putative multiple sugar transport system permease protein|uniref:Xylose transport system permease protein XylH n=1 Tax=Paenibacillus favisporus TaxID=221028 RepID=A0ABV2F218_9BACL|nr:MULTISPECIES: multiple monosaccharide ABC transporter permease [Paenibacillus]MBJ9990941.1 sugar ABC transporter permease [Paenibacillus sp. S28]MCM2997092.1 sugar ABC transporter permease [Paenibacillus cellulositrophicus]MEC0174939.1 sugar ABC transporter permease [Paenibacillus favisporus]OXL82537.1 ABC transporter permease [Paenibacillus sp. SSG-1]RED41712.1 putative multiple sugar transport system permease protein [Paenibacillus sp. VMFN-D1]